MSGDLQHTCLQTAHRARWASGSYTSDSCASDSCTSDSSAPDSKAFCLGTPRPCAGHAALRTLASMARGLLVAGTLVVACVAMLVTGSAALLLTSSAAMLVTGSTALLMTGSAALAAGTEERFTADELAPLLVQLADRGHDPQRMRQIFFDERLRKVDRVISFNTLNPDSSDHYAQYTEPYAINIARRFLTKQHSLLHRTEQAYGIPAEIFVAVLLVETQFGRAYLPFRVLDVFTTLVVEDNEVAISRHYQRLRNSYPELTRERVAERIQKKAAWASDQLSALLTSDAAIPKGLLELRGSYAGAFGMPQFIPSSYQRWARDGDGDGKRDLDHLPDVLASMGTYLNAHGWSRDAPFSKQYRAVWEYNHSLHYVQAIIEIAFRLKAPPAKRPHRPRRKPPEASPKDAQDEVVLRD